MKSIYLSQFYNGQTWKKNSLEINISSSVMLPVLVYK